MVAPIAQPVMRMLSPTSNKSPTKPSPTFPSATPPEIGDWNKTFLTDYYDTSSASISYRDKKN